MRFGSVCSGIEAASVAWHPLGWETAFLSEIEAFPRSVLQHHYPDTPLHGDFTTIGADDYGSIDLLVGGTPCQSFSIAGLRGGLGDDRGNLALEFLRLADRKRPRWLVWENVPGVLSSNGGRDFGAILGGLVELGYGFAYRVLDAQYVRVDSHPHAVPQRRRRVFVVGYLGDWRCAAAVLFEREGLQGHPAPRREAGQGVAPTISARPSGGGGLGTDFDCDGGLVAHALRGEGFDASEDGTGRRTPLVPVANSGDVSYCLAASAQQSLDAETETETLLAFNHQSGGDFRPQISENLANALQRRQGQAVAIQERAVSENPKAEPGGKGWNDDGAAFPAWSLGSHAGAADGNQTNMSHASGGPVGMGILENASHSLRGGRTQTIATPMAVRRLTPTECERLMGFQDGYTQVPYRGKPASDGPRYKALGNSMAVNVMSWLGQRIQMVDRL